MIFALLAVMVAGAAAVPRPLENIPILKLLNEQTPGGGYDWSYETGNGIKASEIGKLIQTNDPENPQVIVAEGGYSYTSPEGTPVDIKYKATDDGGFVATGDAIPTPPPIPPEIQRTLDFFGSKRLLEAGKGPVLGRRRR